MVPFEIEIELNNIPGSVEVEQLDYLADENGRIRYDVRSGFRQAVILVDIGQDPAHPDFTFEAMQAIGEPFSGEELLAIIKGIRGFNNQLRVPFTRLPFAN